MALPPPLFGQQLERHVVAVDGTAADWDAPGVTWIWAQNGIFKRGRTPHLSVQVRAGSAPPVPGLQSLLPFVRWSGVSGRLPGGLLPLILSHAADVRGIVGARARPIEQQYFIVQREPGRFVVRRPRQDATAGHISYQMPAGADVLVDLHSHHDMQAYFSATDDRDDTGLSVSVVIGNLFKRPQIRCRLNVYGHRQEVPALAIFDAIVPFVDVGGTHAGA